MIDAEDARVAPETWRDYLKDMKETWLVWRWIWQEVVTATCRRYIVVNIVAVFVAVVLSLAQPWAVSYIINGLEAHNNKMIVWAFVAFAVFNVLQSVANRYESAAREWIFGLNMGVLDHQITKRFFGMSMGQHMQESSLLTSSNIDKGRWKVIEMQGVLLFEAIPVGMWLLISYVMILLMSPVAGGIIAGVVAVYVVWMFFLNHRTIKTITKLEKEFRALNRRRVERWDKIERVKTSGKEQEELAEMDAWWARIIILDRDFWLWYIDSCSWRGLVNMAGMVLVMVYATWLVWTGEWHIGMFFPLYVAARGFVESLWRVGTVEQKFNANLPSIRAMCEAIKLPPDIVCPPNAKVIHYTDPVRVMLDSVSHHYPSKKASPAVPTIRDVSFTIEPGEKVALMGPSGAGKTTIMRLLLRFMDPVSGRIRLNGHCLSDVDLASWLSLVGYIPQQASVLDGTIRYNLLYGMSAEQKAAITDDELWRIMRLLKIDFGERLTEGLETVVGRNGVKLSGGQGQRLMIGAAVLKKPIFMVIDEATSSLDSTTEREVHEGLAEILGGNISALIVTHRLSTVEDLCTKFVVLKNATDLREGESQIEAIGSSFEELYERSATFQQLADDQGIVIAA